MTFGDKNYSKGAIVTSQILAQKIRNGSIRYEYRSEPKKSAIS
jgi:hypothetical protein